MLKKLTSWIMTAVLVLSLFGTMPLTVAAADGNWLDNAAIAFNGGTGTSADPYQIATAEQLAYLASNTISNSNYTDGKFFVITDDIDLSAHFWTPINMFRGSLDGQEQTIMGLTINDTTDTQGLIAQVGAGAVLKNIILEDCDIIGGRFVGALFGSYEAPGTLMVENCHSSGTVTATDYVGGLFGDIQGTSMGASRTITNCSSSCAVTSTTTGGNYSFAGGLMGRSIGQSTSAESGNIVIGCFATGDVTGQYNIGGLVGWSANSSFVNCYATGDVTDVGSGYNTGGLIGCGNVNVMAANCYATGSVTGNTFRTGGVIGGVDSTVSVTSSNSYYNSLNGTGERGISETLNNMQHPDFTVTLNALQSPLPWTTDSESINGGFPVLTWQLSVPPALYGGEINIENGTGTGSGWRFSGSEILITASGSYRVYGTGVQTSNYITVDSGITATVMLDNVNMRHFHLLGSDTVTVILKDGTTNTLRGSAYSAALRVPNGTTVTIQGEVAGTGQLTAIGSNGGSVGYGAAGIGGNHNEGAGTIIINGGIITATGGSDSSGPGAGIGGGGASGTTLSGGTIAIHGGTVSASGGFQGGWGSLHAPGIGGYEPTNLVIDGGTVTAYGGVYAINASSMAIGQAASVRAFSANLNSPAIMANAAPSGHDAYLLSFSLDTAVSVDTSITVTRKGSAAETFTLTIPNGYRNFATTVETSNLYTAALADSSQIIVERTDETTDFPGILQGPSTAFSNYYVKLMDVSSSSPILQSAEVRSSGTKIILTFDKNMSDPAGTQGQFSVSVDDISNPVTAVSFGTLQDIILLTLTTPVTPGQSVKVSYTPGTLTASDGGVLESFTNQSVTNNVPAVLIGATEYPTLAGALAAATGADTIVLISDITYSNAIKAETRNVTIDLNGFDLTVSGVAEHALQATNGYVLTITDVDNDSGTVSVSSSGAHKFAAYAVSGGDIIIEGTLSAVYPGGFDNQEIIGAYASGNGSTIHITGNANGYTAGTYSQNDAAITVTGNVSGSYYGAYAAYNGDVHVTGDVSGSRALVVEYAGTAEVEGNITGSNYAIEGTTDFGWDHPIIRVTGNVTGTGGAAISASNAADIQVTGDVTGCTVVSGSSSACPDVTINGDITVSTGFGVSVYYGGTVTVNGRILGATPYLKLDNLNIMQDNYNEISGDYYKYSNQTVDTPAPFASNTVYVTKVNQAPVITSNWNYTTVYFGKDYAYTLTVTDTENTTGTKIYSSLDGAPYSIVWSYPGAPGTQNMILSPIKGVLAAGSHTLNYYAQDTDGAVSNTLNLTFVVTDEPASPPPTGGGDSSNDTGTKITVATTDGSASVTGTLTLTDYGTQIVIKNDAFDKLDNANKQVTVNAQMATVSFDKRAMDAIGESSGSGDITLTVRRVGVSELSDAQKALVGERPVFDFTVKSGNSTISSFGGGYATVSIPYTLLPGENPYAVVVWYLSDSSKLVGTRGCYNAATGTVTFMTPHFSGFVIGYNAVSFADVASGSWYHNAVGFIAARGITTGTGNGTFSPDATLTRGQFIVMLLRAFNIEADANPADNFSDAGNSYYTGYLAAAKRLGISQGIGNNLFAPDKAISRQEMFTLLYNALKVIGQLPQGDSGKTLTDFKDVADIASWAKDAMTLLVETGTISGNDGWLSPTDTTTRAEMAQVLYNLLMK